MGKLARRESARGGHQLRHERLEPRKLMAASLDVLPAELYGKWTGTFTPLQSAAPLEISASGITSFTTSDGFFAPEPWTPSFAASTKFPFAFDFGSATSPPGTGSFLARSQAGASFSGTTLNWDENVLEPLTDGSEMVAKQTHFAAVLQLAPDNSGRLLLTGHWEDVNLAQELPATATGTVISYDADFSLESATVGSTVSVVSSVPSAVTGDSVRFTARVAGLAGTTTPEPTGTVTFSQDGNALAARGETPFIHWNP